MSTADATAGTARVLDADPDLGVGLDAPELALARQHAVADVLRLECGAWDPAQHGLDPDSSIGLLVLRGLMSRRVELAASACTELLGQGDVLRPWQEDFAYSFAHFEVEWQVLDPVEIAVLDRHFGQVIGRWPALARALLARAVQRSRYLAFHLAVNQMTRVDVRLRVTLWFLAERWGRVSADGVVLPIRLTHQRLALLVGAQRPSVTTALGQLSRAGEILRRPDGSWLLRGEPPRQLARAGSASA